MKRIISVLAVILAMVTVLASFAACAGEVETTVNDETDPVAVDDTTVSSEETKPDETEPEVEYTLLKLDFETELSLADYIAATEGIAINDTLNGGEIKDGKWVYSGRPLAIKDEMGFYSLNNYSIEFDFCFNSFVNKDNTSVFSLITDDDGVLNGESAFYVPLKMDMNGDIYHNSANTITVQVEKGKVYHYKLEVDKENSKVSVYIDGNLLVSPSYKQDLRQYQCVRFMDNSRGADFWIDNLVVTDIEAVKNASTDKIAKAVDGAYTRGGQYANEPQGLAEDTYIELKYTPNDRNYDRHGFLKFDISRLKREKVKYAVLYANFPNLNTDSLFDIYWVDSEWDSATLTYNNMPVGEKIFENISFSHTGFALDFSEFIRVALADGEKYFSIRISPTNMPSHSQTRLYFTNDQKPLITIYSELPTNGYFTDLTGDEVKNKEIWGYAQKMYDEWYARYQALPGVNEDAILLGRDESQYTKTNYMSAHSTNYDSSKTAHKSRPFDALTDFDEYVSCEHIVCICHRQHCTESCIQHDKIEALFFRNDFLEQLFTACCDGQEHNYADQNRQQCFQGTDSQFVTPGCREMTHHKCEGFPILHHIHQQDHRQYTNDGNHCAMYISCDTAIFDQWCDDTAEHGKEDAEERYIMY